MRHPILIFVLIFALALGIAGTSMGGIQGTGFARIAAVGTVTSTGDVTVNGTTYVSANAHVSVNGQPAGPRQLRVGQVVRIEGSSGPGGANPVADDIAYVGDVRGPVSSINVLARTFRVLGQTVRITEDTVLSVSFVDLLAGTRVEASGFENAAGEIVAARVSLGGSNSDSQLRGAIEHLDSHARTFTINGVLVDYDDAAVTGPIAPGAEVFVRGDANGATLVAGLVEALPPLGAPGAHGDVEGIVTEYVSNVDFWLDGVHVIGDERTNFKVAVGPNVAVNVKGRFQADGALRADKVEAPKPAPPLGLGKGPKPKQH